MFFIDANGNPHGTCQICGQRIILDAKGYIKSHDDYSLRGKIRLRTDHDDHCVGSYKLPYEVSRRSLGLYIEAYQREAAWWSNTAFIKTIAPHMVRYQRWVAPPPGQRRRKETYDGAPLISL